MPDKETDLAAMWRRFLGDMETGVNAFAGKAMESEGFSRMMNQTGGLSMAAQKAFGEAMEKYLAGMNLPSRAQLASFGDRLQAIENHLFEIKATLHEMGRAGAASEDGAASAPKPPRTRRPATDGQRGCQARRRRPRNQFRTASRPKCSGRSSAASKASNISPPQGRRWA